MINLLALLRSATPYAVVAQDETPCAVPSRRVAAYIRMGLKGGSPSDMLRLQGGPHVAVCRRSASLAEGERQRTGELAATMEARLVAIWSGVL